jgi:uridine kinase
MLKRDKVFIIGITGISGAGKSLISKRIQSHFIHCSIYELDHCYKSIAQIPLDSNGKPNFDLPECIDIEKANAEIQQLLNWKSLSIETYNYNNPDLLTSKRDIPANPILIIDGLYLNCLALDFDIQIFVETPLETAKIQRIQRDAKERSLMDVSEIEYQWTNHVLPSFHQHILPQKSNADIVIQNQVNYPKVFEQDMILMFEKLRKVIEIE